MVWTYLVGAFLATLIGQPVSHYLSLALCPKLYKSLGTKKLEWNSRVVSTAHAVITTAMCLLVFYTEKPVIWDITYQGHDDLPSKAIAIITGYLAGDLLVVLFTFTPWAQEVISGPVSTCIHHILGIVTFTQCLHYHCAYIFILLFAFTEISTPFVNFRWFLSQAGVSHGLLYLVNGFLMVLIFFLARVVMIPVQFYIVFSNIRLFNTLTNTPLTIFYLFGLVVGAGLNTYWFQLMIKGLLKLLLKYPKKAV